ncbi:protein of unknown function [Paraburkholderia dioscoreae]|uniref:Uncharacterized protein n=1 Tax=Paraburkholderia dioscoreae TaxID=2604047 RepID=A0A5Q4Z9R6_9BURK|nr:protein of unknown function [Paraburkholderia dioscoreae]
MTATREPRGSGEVGAEWGMGASPDRGRAVG